MSVSSLDRAKAGLLPAAAVSALMVAPARAATITVNNQAQFDAAVAVATQPGHTDTIDASAAGTIDAGTSLTLPAAATSVNLTFGTLGIGANTTDGTATLGAGTTVSFGQSNNPGEFDMGFGHTGTLNINGASLIFNVTNAGTQFNIGLDGGNGIVNMTSGAVTIDQSNATPGVIGSISIAYPFGVTAANATFNQSGGTVSLSGGAFNVGIANGNGTYNLFNTGALLAQGATVDIGASAGGVGILNISGNASIDLESVAIGFAGQLFVGDDLGVGTITQNGAGSTVTLNIITTAQFGSNASAGPSLGGTGTYNLMAGTLNVGGGGVGFGMAAGGVGIFNQSGGTLNATSRLIIGYSGTGTYNMSGGTATLGAGLIIADLAGSAGTVNQTGGLVTISGGSLAVGVAGAGATYNLNGGMLQAGGANGITGTGALNLGGGTLQVIASALTTNTAIGLTGANSTVDTNGFGATFGGVMSGAGGFVKTGAGTLSLTATNTYIGATTISAGTLQIGNGGTSGSIVGSVVDNATLAFNRSDASAFAGAISGTGGVTKIGAGVMTLSGPGSYAGVTAINGGTLQAGATNAFSAGSAYTVAAGAVLALASFDNAIGSLAGSGSVTLGAAALTSGGDGTSTTFSGAIGGTGGLTKIGDGTLFLTGTSGYTGPTNVNAGVLDVNGSLASTVSVNSGATLMGGGTIGGLNVANGGIVAPGNSIGTLHVTGNVGFTTGAVYQVQINTAGQSDLIAAGGHATLTGGNVQVFGTPTPNLNYTILTAQGGVSGTFTSVTAPASTFQGFVLDYTPTSVLLSQQQTQAFANVATTPNQAAIAAALAALPTSNPVFQAVLTQTSAAGAQQAFNALSGEIHASTQTVILDDSRMFRQAMLGRLRQAGFDGETGPMSALSSGGPLVAYSDTAPDFASRYDPAVAALAYAASRDMPFAVKAPSRAMATPEIAWWTQGVGAWSKVNGDGNAVGVSRAVGGFFTGVDRRVGDNWRLGLAGGYTDAGLNDSARASSAGIGTAQLGAYAGAKYGSLNFRAGTAIGWSSIDTSRSIAFPGFSDIASARYGATTAQMFDEVGYGMALGAVAVEPFAGFAWAHLSTQGFNETATTMAALSGSSSQHDVAYSTLGARAAANTILPNGMTLTPRVSVAWQHAFGDLTPGAVLAFEGAGTAFTVAGVPLARDAALIETGVDVQITKQTTLGIAYTGQLAPGLQDHSVKGNFVFRF